MKQKFLGELLFQIARVWKWTLRYQYIGEDNLAKARLNSPKEQVIFCLWHQNLFCTSFIYSKRTHHILISSSDDGELIAHTLKRLGHRGIRGSSTRGGAKAFKEMLKVAKKGGPLAITIDGPKGPAREVKSGALEVARFSGGALVPLSVLPQKFICFNSWDKFRLPLPFSRVLVYAHPPHFIKRSEGEKGREEVSIKIKKALDNEGPLFDFFNL